MENQTQIQTTKWSSKVKRNRTSTVRLHVVNHTERGVTFGLDAETDPSLNAAIVGSYLSITPKKSLKEDRYVTVNARYRGKIIAKKVICVGKDGYLVRSIATGLILGITIPVVAGATAGALIGTLLK
mgnify:FL=1